MDGITLVDAPSMVALMVSASFGMSTIPQKSIIIELHDERYSELIVEVNDPLFAVEQIQAKLQAWLI